MKLEKLKSDITFGHDIVFRYNNKDYTIIGSHENGPLIGEHDTDDDYVYKTADELVNNHKLDGKFIKDIIDDIEILTIY